MVVSIQPGKNSVAEKVSEKSPRNVTTVDTLMDLVRNMFPPNLVEACIAQHQTKIEFSPPKSVFGKIQFCIIIAD